jgi:hypothetical protein
MKRSLVSALLALALVTVAGAQTRFTYSSGQVISVSTVWIGG